MRQREIPDGVVDWYRRLVREVAHEGRWLYLYNFPQMSGVPLGDDLTARIVEACGGAIGGYKDSSGDRANSGAVARRFGDLDVFVGTEARMSDLLALGGAGWISATASVQPRTIAPVVAAAPRARAAAQARVSRTRDAFSDFSLVPAVKVALAEIHGDAGWTRLCAPLRPLTDARRRALVSALGL
ncbi:MAG: dihydrodipicolinate synthase family protein [Caulobacteraceae bacterium]